VAQARHVMLQRSWGGSVERGNFSWRWMQRV